MRPVGSRHWASLRRSFLPRPPPPPGGRVAKAVLSPGILGGGEREGTEGEGSGVFGSQLLATLPSIWMRLSQKNLDP